MQATEARRALYEEALRSSLAPRREGILGDGGASGGRRGRGGEQRLSTRDTFELYQTLMRMADEDEGGRVHERRQIDKVLFFSLFSLFY